MIEVKNFGAILALAVLIAGGSGVFAAQAQTNAPQTNASQANAPAEEPADSASSDQPGNPPAAALPGKRGPGAQAPQHSRVEGRIDFLRSRIKPTDEQAPLFEKVAEAMRLNDKATQALFKANSAAHHLPKAALDRIDMRVRFQTVMIENERRFADAFKPLYDALTPDQKASADQQGVVEVALRSQ